MARKKKGDGGGALTTAAEVAAATVGIAATAYKAVQAYREGDGTDQRDGPRGGTRATPKGAGDKAHALVAYTPPTAEAAPPVGDAAPAGLSAIGGDEGRALGAASVVAAAAGVAKALLDLNAAPPDALMGLRKIGRKRAKRIVAHRPFVRVKDLKRVLPKRVYKAVKHQLTV